MDIISLNKKDMKKEGKNLLDDLNKASGKRLAFFGDDDSVEKVDVIPTGIPALDYALGCGGIPRGKITDLFGMPSAGKSTFCFTLIAQAQKMGIQCALIDAEYSYNPDYVAHFGASPNSLIIIQPDCFEEAAEAVEALIKNDVGLIIIDSISSLVPRAEAEAEHGKSPMAIQARLVSQMLRKLIASIAKNNTALICVNQMRVNIMSTNPYDKYTVTGGFALRFYSSIRIQMSRVKSLMKGDVQVGYNLIFKIKKNKVARGLLSCDAQYFFDTGFEGEGDIVSMALDKKILTKEGNTISHKGEKLAVGKEKAREAIESNHELKTEILNLLFPENQQ